MSEDLVLRITRDEALVLFELFSRFETTNELVLRHNAEFLALSRIAAQLEKSLPEPFSPDYARLLLEAQSRIASGFEGLAPGVSRDGA